MRSLMLGIAALTIGVGSTVASATDDPIATRKHLMQANGSGMGAAQAMIKGEVPYNPAIALATLKSFNAVFYSFGDYFPAGSDQGDTSASPHIWEDMAGFQKILADLRTHTDAAIGTPPQDLQAFQAAIGPIGQGCQSCHEEYRLKNN